MNAKKIMGAVLVALLAAALFVGAGAAGNVGTFFAYETGLDTNKYDGVWQYGTSTVTVRDGVVSDVLVPGTYKFSDYTAYFTKPTATYSAIGNLTGVKYIVSNGGNVYEGSNVTLTVTALATNSSYAPDMLRVESPNGAVEFVGTDYYADKKVSDVGTYKVQAVWSENFANFTSGAPLPVVDANVFTFTVVEPSDATITASVDTIFAGDVIGVTIKGTPGVKYNLGLTGIDADKQALTQIVTLKNVSSSLLNFTMPNIGEVTFLLETNSSATKEVKIELATETDPSKVIGEVEIAVTAPVVTATLGAPSYFVGEDVKVTLSSTGKLGDGYTFKIAGTNFAEAAITAAEEEDGDKLVYTLHTNKTKLDVGTYTIKVYKNGVVATLPVAFKQPFISVAEAPEVIAQNKSATFLINAEATTAIQAYIFGTNKFIPVFNGSIDYEEDEDGEDILNLFNVTLDAGITEKMATGQYFAVFQHPMYDGFFNINATNAGDFYLNADATPVGATGNTLLFNAKDRQTANAAQALCDALDSQNIDDMYVKYSFFVVKELEKGVYTISDIPTEVVKGDKIVISGVATEYDGQTVAVEMVSTAFAAVPKETVGSAAFILVTTKVADDGTWEVTLDTSDLNVDEYSLSVAFDSLEKESVTVNVVEGSEPVTPTDEPTVVPTDEPVTPTEAPATPGFGALAALAGLGAVAVLLLRRE